MQYILSEEEYKKLSERPTAADHENLVNALRLIAMKAAGQETWNCGKGYCGDCVFSGSFAPREGGVYVYRNICPNPEARNFSK